MKIKARKFTFQLKILLVCLWLFFLTCSLSSGQNKTDLERTDSISNNKIVVVGDTQHKGFMEYFIFHEDNSKETKILFKRIADENPAIVVHLGDITAFRSSKNQWENFDSDALPVTEKDVKIYPVFGNHDYYGNNDECYNNFYDHFPYLSGSKWYSIVQNRIAFIMINSNYDNLSNEEIKAQRKWYLNFLDSMDKDSNIDYVIVCGHHPPYTNSTVVSPDNDVRNDFAIPFQHCYKGAVFFSGHCHSYEKFMLDGKYFIVSGGGGGSRQKLDIDKLTREFNDLFEGPELRFFHYCEITTENDSLILKVKKLNKDHSVSIADEIKIPISK